MTVKRGQTWRLREEWRDHLYLALDVREDGRVSLYCLDGAYLTHDWADGMEEDRSLSRDPGWSLLFDPEEGGWRARCGG